MQPIIELKSELEGIIKLEVIKEDGTLKEAEGLNVSFKNLITDAGLNSLAEGNEISYASRYCKVGTSSNTPAVSDTALGAKTGSASSSGTKTSSVQYSTTPYYSQHQTVYTFAVGAVSGNLTEIGFFSADTGGIMWSRALIKDSGGNPTTLTLLATEQLKVTYIVRRYIPTSLTGSFTLNTNGTYSTINYTITPAFINFSGKWNDGFTCVGTNTTTIYAYETQTLGGITSPPSGTPSSNNSCVISPYIVNSFQREYTYTIATSEFVFSTGVGSLTFCKSLYQCSFTPKIPKTSSQTLSIGIVLSWGRTAQQ